MCARRFAVTVASEQSVFVRRMRTMLRLTRAAEICRCAGACRTSGACTGFSTTTFLGTMRTRIGSLHRQQIFADDNLPSKLAAALRQDVGCARLRRQVDEHKFLDSRQPRHTPGLGRRGHDLVDVVPAAAPMLA